MMPQAPSFEFTRRAMIFIGIGWLTLLVPLFSFTYFPSQDGPAHVNSAAALLHIASGDHLFQAFFRATSVGLTNWVTGILYGFLINYVGPAHTDMTAVILYVLFALAIIHLCCGFFFRTRAECALLFYPLVFTHMLHMGSYNLSLGVFGFLATTAICFAYLTSRRGYLLWLLMVVLLVTYMLHIQIAMLALIVIWASGLWVGGYEKHQGTSCKKCLGEIIKLNSVCAPVVVLIGLFFLQNGSQIISRPIYIGILGKLKHILFLSGLASYSVFGLIVSMTLLLAGLVLIAVIARKRLQNSQFETHDFLLLAASLIGLLFFVMPDGVGDAFNIEERIMVPWLMVITSWLIIEINKMACRTYVMMVALLFLGLQTFDRVIAFVNINQNLNEFNVIKTCLPNQSAFISLDLDNVAETPLPRSMKHPFFTVTRFNPYVAFPGTLFADREMIDAVNYEALSVRPYFALKYQPWLNDIVGKLDVGIMAKMEPETGDFTAFIERMKKAKYPIDYLVTSSFLSGTKASNTAHAVNQIINQNYTLLCVSPSRTVQVYHRNALFQK